MLSSSVAPVSVPAVEIVLVPNGPAGLVAQSWHLVAKRDGVLSVIVVASPASGLIPMMPDSLEGAEKRLDELLALDPTNAAPLGGVASGAVLLDALRRVSS